MRGTPDRRMQNPGDTRPGKTPRRQSIHTIIISESRLSHRNKIRLATILTRDNLMAGNSRKQVVILRDGNDDREDD